MARRYNFEREYRTAYSEGYTITENDTETARVDVHFTPTATYATLCIQEGLADEDIDEMIRQVDDEIVQSHDPYREDFIVTVWAGRPAGIYSDEDEDWDIEEDEEDVDGNGHRP